MKWPFTRTARAPEARTVTHEDFYGRAVPSLIAGERVSTESALGLSAIYCAVRTLSETISTLPLALVERDGDAREPVRDHPALRALHTPNAMQTGQGLLEVLISHMELNGEAFAEVVRDTAGRPAGVWPLRPGSVTPERRGAEILFKVATRGGVIEAGADRILHLKNSIASPDGLRGVSPVSLLREDIGAALAARNFAAGFFAEGGTPSGCLTHPAALNEQSAQRLRDQWKRQQTGRKGQSVLVLEEGLKFEALGTSPEAAQLLESRRYSVADVGRAWRIPVHLLGDNTKLAYNSAVEEMRSFAQLSILPRCRRIESQLDAQLLTPQEREDLAFRFTIDGLLRADLKTRYEAHAAGINAGFLTRNEARALENLPPLEGLDSVLQMPGATLAGGGETQPGDGAQEENAA